MIRVLCGTGEQHSNPFLSQEVSSQRTQTDFGPLTQKPYLISSHLHALFAELSLLRFTSAIEHTKASVMIGNKPSGLLQLAFDVD